MPARIHPWEPNPQSSPQSSPWSSPQSRVQVCTDPKNRRIFPPIFPAGHETRVRQTADMCLQPRLPKYMSCSQMWKRDLVPRLFITSATARLWLSGVSSLICFRFYCQKYLTSTQTRWKGVEWMRMRSLMTQAPSRNPSSVLKRPLDLVWHQTLPFDN